MTVIGGGSLFIRRNRSTWILARERSRDLSIEDLQEMDAFQPPGSMAGEEGKASVGACCIKNSPCNGAPSPPMTACWCFNNLR